MKNRRVSSDFVGDRFHVPFDLIYILGFGHRTTDPQEGEVYNGPRHGRWCTHPAVATLTDIRLRLSLPQTSRSPDCLRYFRGKSDPRSRAVHTIAR